MNGAVINLTFPETGWEDQGMAVSAGERVKIGRTSHSDWTISVIDSRTVHDKVDNWIVL